MTPPATVLDPAPAVSPFRLPHTFEPSRYRARLALDEHRFVGHVEIDGVLGEEVSLIWLHGVDLIVTRATAMRGETVVPLEFSPPRTDQVLGFQAKSPLPVGQWTLSIDYSGPIRELDAPAVSPYGGPYDAPALGVFRRVIDKRTYVYTQSEPIYARRIFPCIDEPDRKVPWQLSLDVPKGLLAASNTAVVRETAIDKDHKRVEFAETSPLPSYLIAFAVGPFDVVEAPTPMSGTPIRILVPHGHGAAVATSAKVTPKILDLLESWLAIPYPYGKLDLVSVPQLGFGAMENAGLVTFTASSLESTDSASIIGHELAHQWFGNLVTLAWWDDIWLNESFAELMAEKIEASLAAGTTTLPDAREARIGALTLLTRYVPVRGDVRTLDALDARSFVQYDPIHRGGSLLTLVEADLGPERFWKAIRGYLGEHAHGTVVTADLIHAFSDVSRKPIDKTITTLLDAPMPSLEVRLTCQGRIRVRLIGAQSPTLVCVAYDRDGKRAERCATIDDKSLDVPLPGTSCPRWVMPNAGGTGLYRIDWTKPVVDALLARGWGSLTASERQTMFDEVDDEALKLSIFVKLAKAPPSSVSEVSYLLMIAKYVPADLRPRFDAWVQARYGQRARDLHFRERNSDGVRARLSDLRIVELVALTHDPQLTAEALQLAAHYRALPQDSWFLVPVLGLAANADSKIRDSLFTDLDTPRVPSSWPRSLFVEALSRVSDIVGVVNADPSKLDAIAKYEGRSLFGSVCAPTDRTVLAALLEDEPKDRFRGVLATIDQCYATRKLLEPELRRWLGTMK